LDKKKISAFSFILLIGIASFVSASMLIPANENAEDKILKEGAIEPNGLIRVDFIHYANGKSAAVGQASACYKLLGVKWADLPVSYTINPANSGLNDDEVISAISTSAETWDSATSKELFSNFVGINNPRGFGQDYVNTIMFGNIADNRIIAQTSIWYIPRGKRLVEFDVVFNNYYEWGDASINPTLMDLQNIATHELGHGAGLDDLYNSVCSLQTMYGYSNDGETIKRDLASGDIAGIKKLYG